MPVRNDSLTFIIHCTRGGSSQKRWMHEKPGLFELWPGSSLCLLGYNRVKPPQESLDEHISETGVSLLTLHTLFQPVMDSASIWVCSGAFTYLLAKPRGIPTPQICFHHKNTRKWAAITQLCSRVNSRHCSELRGGNSKGNGETARDLAG